MPQTMCKRAGCVSPFGVPKCTNVQVNNEYIYIFIYYIYIYGNHKKVGPGGGAEHIQLYSMLAMCLQMCVGWCLCLP